MLQLLAFARSRLGRYAIAALALLALSFTLYAKGSHDGKTREVRAEAARLVKARKAVAKREVKAAAISEHVAADLTKERQRIVYRTRTITQEIPREVTPADDAACRVPDGWVRLHDAAALGSPPAVPKPAR